eukprot:3483941-Pleurochrysis_carterae.AAC.3
MQTKKHTATSRRTTKTALTAIPMIVPVERSESEGGDEGGDGAVNGDDGGKKMLTIPVTIAFGTPPKPSR